jgi:hypothetical protein
VWVASVTVIVPLCIVRRRAGDASGSRKANSRILRHTLMQE